MALSKSDAREVQNLAIHLKLGNDVAVRQGALSFIRSATSDAVQRKRLEALRAVGIVVVREAA